jgi:hypothetical protein
MDYAEIAEAIVALMGIPEPWVLSIDRTDWQFGDCVFLVLNQCVFDRFTPASAI